MQEHSKAEGGIMDIHPWTNYEIARLRNEERLQRAQQAQRAAPAREEQPAEAGTHLSAAVRLLRRIRRRRALAALGHTIVFRALFVTGIFLALASIALAHGTRWAWTERKAEQIVTRDAAVRLASPERAALENELRTAARYYSALYQGVREEPHQSPAADPATEYTLDKLGRRFQAALRKVRSGLSIDVVQCTGSGVSVRSARFERFRCLATSSQLLIPSADVAFSEDGRIEAVVEREPRTIGPFQTRLDVRVAGKSTIAYRKIG
jgi:hypothetical protein